MKEKQPKKKGEIKMKTVKGLSIIYLNVITDYFLRDYQNRWFKSYYGRIGKHVVFSILPRDIKLFEELKDFPYFEIVIFQNNQKIGQPLTVQEFSLLENQGQSKVLITAQSKGGVINA